MQRQTVGSVEILLPVAVEVIGRTTPPQSLRLVVGKVAMALQAALLLQAADERGRARILSGCFDPASEMVRGLMTDHVH